MKKITSITIVGGGTSGWLAAKFFDTNYNIPVTVIDKNAGEPIGFGEATVMSFDKYMQTCGLQHTDWFSEVEATFKAGILFPNWKKEGHTIWHPFLQNLDFPEASLQDLWISNFQDNDFKQYGLVSWDHIQDNRLPLQDIKSKTVAFQLDCGKLVQWLQKSCNRVQLIKQGVVKVNRNEEGFVESLDLEDGSNHESDFYFDCTGFASVLKEQDGVDLCGNGRLFTNAAVACQVPFESDDEITPYTRCPAVEHGWIWEVPTQTRYGSGLVFNRHLTSIDDACKSFAEHWKGRVNPDDLRMIHWEPYYIKNFWENNVVSIGLAGGFVEPLESTGIESATRGVLLAVTAFGNRLTYHEEDVNYYNHMMTSWYEDCVDFINLHYADTERNDETKYGFWGYVKETHVKSDRMLDYIEWLKDPRFTVRSRPNENKLFTEPNWALYLIQMGYEANVILPHIDRQSVIDFMFSLWRRDELFKPLSPKHRDAIELANNGFNIFQELE